MKKADLKLGGILFILGFSGILSLLGSDLLANLPEEILEEALKVASRTQLKLLTLISPTSLLLITILIGIVTFKRAMLSVPTLENLIAKNPWKPIFIQQLRSGFWGGILAGFLIVGISYIFMPYMPAAFTEAQEKSALAIYTRFLYGGITEEILIRFGIMSLIAWLCLKITKGSLAYWIAIAVSSIIFALGHFPIIFQIIDTPSTLLLVYILLGNIAGGLVFGWLYWKKGLEAAMIAHIITHVVMLLFSF